MTPEELDAFLRVARAHGVTRLRLGAVSVELGAAPPAAAPPVPRPLPPATEDELLDRVEATLFAHERFSG